MEILDVNLKHFGKFQEHRMTFKPGLNIIYGGNETGKTTIHAFIKAMFFGIGRGRGRRISEYDLRQPWENSSYFSGMMRIRCGAEILRIERNFDKNAKELRVINETKGQELPADEELMQKLSGGLSEAAFRNTVFISQGGSATDDGLAEELRRYMVNFRESRDGGLDVDLALQELKVRKKEVEQKKKQKQAELDEQIGRKQIETEYVRENLQKIQRKAGASATNHTAGDQGVHIFSDNNKTEASESAEKEGYTENSAYTKSLLSGREGALAALLGITGCMLACLCAVFAQGLAGKLLLLLLAVIMGAVGLYAGWIRFAGRETTVYRDEKTDERREAAVQQRKMEAEELKKAERQKRLWKREMHEQEFREEEGRLKMLQQETKEMYHQREELHEYDREAEAIDLAALRIRELSAQIYQETGPELARRASEILEELTEGCYTQIALDENLQVRINTPAKLLYLDQVSYGTKNQIYFALRMAAGELLSGRNDLPVILDEAFAMYDDDRLEAVMRWLNESDRQVILFTCQKREHEIQKRLIREGVSR